MFYFYVFKFLKQKKNAHSFPGFCRLRMHTKGGSPCAFIEYQDVRVAAQAMATLQGTFLLSSDRGAIRIEYAKSKMAADSVASLTTPSCWIEVCFTPNTIFLYNFYFFIFYV